VKRLASLLEDSDTLEGAQKVMKYVTKKMDFPLSMNPLTPLTYQRQVQTIRSDLVPLFQDLSRVASVSNSADFQTALEAFNRRNEGNPFWNVDWPSMESLESFDRKQRLAQTRVLMFQAALAHLLQDEVEFAKIIDPSTREPFVIENREVGFQVASGEPLSGTAGRMLTLSVGQVLEVVAPATLEGDTNQSRTTGIQVDAAGNVLYPLDEQSMVERINERNGESRQVQE